ncbi:MICOS complex subunit MIC13 homolog QIL1-like [Anopheles nili]|uniref:MICOS complex subunit MIC13 homolog QIL1-like n=1 Tax=Anopheles nili TaxID=185578 RepID=UPI00237AABA5|nr:MICOS complex subunit MIC13 homolog QIL1-like [Anopheles nili]
MFRFAIKVGLAGSFIYYTKQEGIWEEDTEKVYERYAAALKPHVESVKQQIPLDLPALPSSGELCFVTKHYYNEGVKNTIRFIHRLPCYAGQWAKKGSDAIKQALDAPSQNQTVEPVLPAPVKK